MRTKIGVLAANVVESGWLAALVVVPIFFNVYTVRIFEEEKVPLFRSIALVVLAALIVHLLEAGSVRTTLRAVWRLPAVKFALLLAAASIVSTYFSLRPVVSFWGGYVRSQGTYTLLCYLAVFFAVLLVLRKQEQVERLMTIVLLSSLPPALYAIAQRFGSDPIGWFHAEDARSTSTAGNAIFVGAFMVMVAPLTLARCLEHWERLRGSRPGDGNRRSLAWLLVLHVVLLGLQLLTVVFTESRGPFIGLLAGMAVVTLGYALRKGKRWVSFAVAGLIVAGVVFLFVLNVHEGPLEFMRKAPFIGRFAKLGVTTFSSLRVRFIVWQASADLLSSNPSRLLTGFGADTLYLAYRPFLPPQLARHEAKHVIPDRAHNATFDALVTNGVVGCAAEIAFVVAILLVALGAAGLAAPGRSRTRLAVLLIVGGLGGVGLPFLLDGSARFAAPGLALGITAGTILHLLVAGWSGEVATSSHPRALLLIGLLGAIVAHFVEIQVGIPVAATRLYFWTYAALVLALAVPLVREAGPAGAEEPARAATEPWLSGDMVTVIPTVGLVLVVLCANFYRQGLDLARHAGMLALLFGGVWLAGALFVALEPGRERERLGRLVTYAATTLGLCLLFLALYDRWTYARGIVSDSTVDRIRAAALQSSTKTVVIYGFVLLIVGLHAVVGFLRENVGKLPVARAPAVRVLAYVLLLAVVAPLIASTNIAGSRADSLTKLAFAYERAGRWPWAIALHDEALRMRPWEDRYALNLGSSWMERARREPEGEGEQRRRDLENAREAFERAERLSPLDPDHPHNLAKLYRNWTKLGSAPAEREVNLRRADDSYRRAVALAPDRGPLLDDWAILFLESGDLQRGLEILDRSAEVDPEYTTTFWLRANTRAARGELEEAVADYDRALAVDRWMIPALSGKATVLARLGRTDEAIEVLQFALDVDEEDAISWNNLVTLLMQRDENVRALEAAEKALGLVDDEHKPIFEELIAKLR